MRARIARTYCVSRSHGLANAPRNGFAGGVGTHPRVVQRSTAPTTLTEQPEEPDNLKGIRTLVRNEIM